VPKLVNASLNLITADTALHYNQHAAAIICITNNLNLISYYTRSCIFFTCLFIYIYLVLLRVKEQRNILHEISKGKAIGLVTFCKEAAFYSTLLKER